MNGSDEKHEKHINSWAYNQNLHSHDIPIILDEIHVKSHENHHCHSINPMAIPSPATAQPL
jgi:hypothetical protein